jgi:hypothetical protein
VTIGNAPPTLTDVTLVPASIGQQETLSVTANAADADGDPVTVLYAWTVNDAPAGNGPRLGIAIRRGDAVRVEVKATDGRSYSSPVELINTIANHPPVFIEHKNYDFSGTTLVYQAQATDTDGDRITYSLEGQPEGMSIDRNSGKVTWNVPGGYRGEQTVILVADDGHGGFARYSVSFMIRD